MDLQPSLAKTTEAQASKTCTKCGETKLASEFYGAKRNTCKVCHKAQINSRRQTPEGRAVVRIMTFKRVYGISLDASQSVAPIEHQCPICAVTSPGGNGEWHLDHNHETKQLRSWLCSVCNAQFGAYEKKGHLFAAYLNDHAH